LNGQPNLVKGEFIVSPHPDDDDSDFIVDIMVTYDSNDYNGRNSSAICLMQNGNDWGVGIYTPPHVQHYNLDYKITLLVPQTANPIVLPQFNTYLPWFTHTFNDLNNSLLFEDVSIEGLSSSIQGALYGQTVNITTTGASITGSYGAQKSLVLQTSLGEIDANVTLGSDQNGPTSLFMKSSKGPFSATINLSGSSNDSHSGNSSQSSGNLTSRNPAFTPEYHTQISCDDSPITLVLRHDASVDSSLLNVQLNTSLNRALVLLDSKFEGNFDLSAVNSSVLVADLDGDTHSHLNSFGDTFPEHYYKRSVDILDFEHRSSSRAVGCIQRRDNGGDSGSGGSRAQVNVQNTMGLVALGFFTGNQVTSPILTDLSLTDTGLT